MPWILSLRSGAAEAFWSPEDSESKLLDTELFALWGLFVLINCALVLLI